VLNKLKQLKITDYIKRENLSVIIIGVVGFWVAWQTVIVVVKNNQLQLEIAKKREEVALLELENQAIEFEIEYYKTDEFLERSAKENLLLKRPGEKVAIAPLTRDAPFPADRDQPHKQAEPRSNFQQWIDFALGRNSQV